MDDEVYSFALKTMLNEIQTICPEIKNAFIFKEDGEIVAKDPETPENMVVHIIDAFDGFFEKTDSLGDVEAIVLDGTKGRVNVSFMGGFYFVTVASDKADTNYVSTVTRVLVPTILRLLEKINLTSIKNPINNPRENKEASSYSPLNNEKDTDLSDELLPKEEPKKPVQAQPTFIPEVDSTVPEPIANQFIVENIGGLLVPSDTVRIDGQLVTSWTDTYSRKIEDIEIETFGGKTLQCKVKPIKDSKYEGKGIVQMPEKIQVILEVKKGEIVKVKPVIL
jgi:predicted regulator of Ras-like GTPase activity (Roadblock/LC7/MglB family)